MKLETIDLPHDAMSLLDLSCPARLLLEGSHKVAEWLRLFEYPRDIGVNPRRPEKLTSDPLFVAYWTYKTRHPISRAKKGSGIEELFERQEALAKKLLRPCDDPDGEITLSFVGDLMATKGVESSQDVLYDEVAEEIFGADVAFANLESTFAAGDVEDLAEAGADLIVGHHPHVPQPLEYYRAKRDGGRVVPPSSTAWETSRPSSRVSRPRPAPRCMSPCRVRHRHKGAQPG